MIQPWAEISRTEFKGSFRTYETVKFQLPNGVIGDFDLTMGRGFVGVLAITKDKKILVVEQFRPGPRKIFLELPMGMIDKGEAPLECAKRELREETGHSSHQWITAKENIPFSPYSTFYYHAYVALDVDLTDEIKLDETEDVGLHQVDMKEFGRKILLDGETMHPSMAWHCIHTLVSKKIYSWSDFGL